MAPTVIGFSHASDGPAWRRHTGFAHEFAVWATPVMTSAIRMGARCNRGDEDADGKVSLPFFASCAAVDTASKPV